MTLARDFLMATVHIPVVLQVLQHSTSSNAQDVVGPSLETY